MFFLTREVNLIGSLRVCAVWLLTEVMLTNSLQYGPGCYALAVDLVAQGRVNVKPLLTHR